MPSRTYVLVPGAGGSGWAWHLVAERLREHGHAAIPVDLPAADDSADLNTYADVIVEAAGDAPDVVLVAHSLGGFSAPLACARLPVSEIILVNAMIPAPGDSGSRWGETTGYQLDGELDLDEHFFNDVPKELAEQAMAHEQPESESAFEQRWPLDAWPDVPTRVLAGADDRFFTPDFQVRVARERLGLTAQLVPGGHMVALSRPDELTAAILGDGAAAPAR